MGKTKAYVRFCPFVNRIISIIILSFGISDGVLVPCRDKDLKVCNIKVCV